MSFIWNCGTGSATGELGPLWFTPSGATGWQNIGVVAYDVDGNHAWAAADMDVENTNPPENLRERKGLSDAELSSANFIGSPGLRIGDLRPKGRKDRGFS